MSKNEDEFDEEDTSESKANLKSSLKKRSQDEPDLISTASEISEEIIGHAGQDNTNTLGGSTKDRSAKSKRLENKVGEANYDTDEPVSTSSGSTTSSTDTQILLLARTNAQKQQQQDELIERESDLKDKREQEQAKALHSVILFRAYQVKF
jgi:hypothetical protein